MDNQTKAYIVVAIGVVLVLISLGYATSYLQCFSYAGQRYEVDIVVQAVEHSSRFGQHTNVWAQVYGNQDITYKLLGYHKVDVGATYHIEFVNRVRFHWYVGYYVRGLVVEMEKLS